MTAVANTVVAVEVSISVAKVGVDFVVAAEVTCGGSVGLKASDVKVFTTSDCIPVFGPCTNSYTKDSGNASDIGYGADVLSFSIVVAWETTIVSLVDGSVGDDYLSSACHHEKSGNRMAIRYELMLQGAGTKATRVLDLPKELSIVV